MFRFPNDTLVALSAALTIFTAHADEFEVLDARQTAPGNVRVSMALQGAAPQADDLTLQLGDAAPVPARSVTPIDTPTPPVWIMVCVDRSGSIGPAVLEGLKHGLRQALVEGRSGALPFKVALMGFATQPTHLLDFTSDPARVDAAVERLVIDSAPAGRTRMHDAIAGGLAALRAQDDGVKRLIVVSDGKDEGSTTQPARLGLLTQGPPRITIDALALGALAQDHSGAISALAGSSGGRFLPSTDVEDVARPLRRLIAEAAPASRFEVAFEYEPAADGRVAASAAVVHAPDGVAPSKQVLKIGLAARSSPAAVSPPDGGDTTVNLHVIIDWVRHAPAHLLWLAGALLAAALALTYRRMRRPRDDGVIAAGRVQVAVVASPGAAPPPPPRVRSPTSVGHTWGAPSPGRPVAVLSGVSGTARGQTVPIDKAMFRIGCDPGNDLVLVGDDFASGLHALLRFEAGSLYAEDMGSTNGTHLNGGVFKSATRPLAPGDELRFGRSTYKVLAPNAAGRSGYEPAPG